jgi:hypothetical protein
VSVPSNDGLRHIPGIPAHVVAGADLEALVDRERGGGPPAAHAS